MTSPLSFLKYSANGNHFILLDGFKGAREPESNLVVKLCDPIFGVGADGVAFIGPAKNESEAFNFRLWNADGGEAEMCGNAARIAAKHFMALHSVGKAEVQFKTMNGVYLARLDGERLWLKMTEKSEDLRVDSGIFKDFTHWYYLNTGVPHLVLQVPDVDKIDLMAESPIWRRHTAFPRGTNVDYISVDDPNVPFVRLRVFERGVEGETWSCGTGVAAVAWACQKFYGWQEQVTVHTKGGDHIVRWDREGSLWYSGEIKLCFKGELV